ncbi:MAG: Fis family transcriptional regulator [Desulfuromonas sp.]|nr:MAG: Fis family transcriptional regulator [Desulfuromonas sp.]
MQRFSTLAQTADRISSYGKENLDDILHLLSEAILNITGRSRCRIYLEDLTVGQLVCEATAGRYPEHVRRETFPLNSEEFLVSRAYMAQEEAQIADIANLPNDKSKEMASSFSVQASHLLPILHLGRPLGVICIDSSRAGRLPAQEQVQQLQEFIDQVVDSIDQARKYRQQIVLARLVDEAKKKEAAEHMVRAAVRLVDKLALASVLVPSLDDPESSGEGLQILATYSQEKEAAKLYAEELLVNLGPGTSLLSRFINREGVIIDDRMLKPLFIPDLSEETLQKQYLTDELGLKSLYVIPFYEKHSRRVICLVNYYTREIYQFSDFEKWLLESHAEMVQRVIQEIGVEHMEIQVLSDISDLLQERFTGLQPFLNRVLSKATELIGADTGSIAIAREIDGRRMLVVEDEEGHLLGAKSKEWLKKNIPPLPIGGEDLAPQERSLGGYVAFSRRPVIIGDTAEAKRDDGFYREITEVIRSEIAVPVVSEDDVKAVICLDSLQEHYFTEEHKRILLIIGRMIARYLTDLEHIEQLTTEINLLRSDVDYRDPKISSYRIGNIIGNSDMALDIVDFITRTTPPVFNRIASWQGQNLQEATLGLPSILITGDTGSGKEFVFNNIFSRLNEMYQERFGSDTQLSLQKTNIAAYSGELTYSELFGHKRGAFTGAHTDRKGILEEAHGGVVFLDEIGDADPKTQVQLLRFLDNGGFVRLGENVTRYARVLLVAATNKDMAELIRKGTFREDLYHRLSELSLNVPSLNQRREDIPDLATHFLGRLYQIYRAPDDPPEAVPTIDREAAAMLSAHRYSGNIRELRSILLRALFLRRGKVITGANIRAAIDTSPRPTKPDNGMVADLDRETAQNLFRSIVADESDFWAELYTPYTKNKISKEMVRKVIDMARGEGASNMPKIARLLKACDPHSSDPEQKKLFYKFKNFLYKTIHIS